MKTRIVLRIGGYWLLFSNWKDTIQHLRVKAASRVCAVTVIPKVFKEALPQILITSSPTKASPSLPVCLPHTRTHRHTHSCYHQEPHRSHSGPSSPPPHHYFHVSRIPTKLASAGHWRLISFPFWLRRRRLFLDLWAWRLTPSVTRQHNVCFVWAAPSEVFSMHSSPSCGRA